LWNITTNLAFYNQALEEKVDEKYQRLYHVEAINVNIIQIEEKLLEARSHITTYKVMEDNTQELQQQNTTLKKCITNWPNKSIDILRYF
jgi:hypothetical protein